ncbi:MULTISPECIES: hypothetical protein [Micromonospora]|uniref:EcsC family protein n=1 Tax=Micromonospora sicca TaxID=2202420 RepID=A0ABU5JLX6_9ACTN|nr:hypothetical protein [Micromonospora sp. 4G53]MDZ5493586.1 hypothetical protein [Micromonospora sp. 4G53]
MSTVGHDLVVPQEKRVVRRAPIRADLSKADLSEAIETQQPLAVASVKRLRRLHPDKTPAELIAFVNKFYLHEVAEVGARAGAAAAESEVGSVHDSGTRAGMIGFLEASVRYTLSVAEIHSLDVEDIETRKLLVTSVLVGNSTAKRILGPLAGQAAPHWGRQIVESIPESAIDRANKLLGERFITRWGTGPRGIVLGLRVSSLLGGVIGGSGSGLFGWFVIKSSRKILGTPPDSWGDR